MGFYLAMRMGRKGDMGAEALSTEGRKDGRGEEDNLLLRCKAVLLGLGHCRPFNNVKYVGKGEEGPSV